MIQTKRRQGWQIGLLGIIITAVVIVFFASQLNFAQLTSALAAGRYIYLLPCMAALVIGLWTRGLRWRALLKDDLPPMRAFHILNVSYLVNGLLPLRLGEVARAWLASRAEARVTIPRAISTIVVERLLDLLAVLCLVALAATSTLPPELRTAAFALAPLALGGLVVLVVLAANKARTLRWLAVIIERVPFFKRLPLQKIAEDVLDGFAVLAQPAAFLHVVGWTIVSWVFSVVAGYVLMWVFWETASWAATFALIAAASLVIAVPAVPGNIGTFQASIVFALGAFGYGEPLETATAYAVIIHAVNLLMYALLGGIGLLREGVSLAQLRESVGGAKA
jgi:glycosyltransferase 2 family protein